MLTLIKPEPRDTPCAHCKTGVAKTMRAVSVRPFLVLTFRCLSCGHEWKDVRLDPSVALHTSGAAYQRR
jgi:hypothetical protein